ncbi:MAG: GHKL domain-containing protein [Ferruginibacter sp.]|nr:GHKL domain-containing protein [Ferruginibacter sp.]
MSLLLYLVLQACCYCAYPQKQHLQFDHIGTDQGLSQSNVLSVLQDSRGFMWFGTRDGLNKYDGYSFTVYKNNPLDPTSISNNYIMDIIEDKNGDLWVGTLGGGICRYNRNKENFTPYRHDSANTKSIANSIVHSLLEDELGKLWIGTEDGVDMFDPVKNTFEHFKYNPNDNNSIGDSYIRSVFKDSKHNLWIGTMSGGLSLLNKKTKSFTRFRHNKNDSKSISSNNVYTIFEDSKQRLWIGTDGAGMDLFDQKNGIFYHFKHDDNNTNTLISNTVYAINEDAENNLWVGTENGGLSIFNYSTGLFTTYKNDEIDKESISNNSIYSIYKDSKNNMWLGIFAGGVNIANRDKIKFAHFKHMMQKNSLSNNLVLSIFEDSKKNIWIGTDGGGLNLFDAQNNNFTHFRHERDNDQSICGDYVLTACEDSKGNIWIGTWADGVTVFNPSNNTFKHFKNDPTNASSLSNNNAWNIFEDKDKNIWIGTFGGGLNLLNPDNKSFTHFQYDRNRSDGISSPYIMSIFEDSDGEMWVGTDGGGLNRYNKKAKNFSRFLHADKKNSISDNSLNAIFEDDNKNLWVGTRIGLNQFNKRTNRFTVYTVADGLPDNVIFGILEDDKRNLWISTNRGISCFNPVTKVFKNFGVSDGLQSNEFKGQAACKSTAGIMYFGGNNGFNQFSPGNIRAMAFEPPLVITKFQVFNKDVPIAINKNDPSTLKKSITETSSITLPYSNTVFSFEFATLNYTTSEKKRYAYMLEGFDKSWNEAGTNRIATYTNLDPGKYLFKVKGLNNEGTWSSNIRNIELIIEPPFWLTWWFKLSCFIAVTGSVLAFYRFRMNAIEHQKAKLQQQVHEQTRLLVLSTKEEQKARNEAENSRIETELANKELKIKNKELEQFVYVASHDLQEPLRTTSGFVELIQQQYHGKLDARADKYLDFISEASSRMKILIKDLLDFSRIGKKAALQKIDCNIILKNIQVDIMAAIQESKACIQYDLLPVICGYPTEIKLLFQNLLINAIKFRRKGVAPQIKITTRQNEGFWKFSISDNGIGIEKQHSDRIFDIFQRLHTRTEYEGSGIGLSHCKKIVELHQGKIWMESVTGEGSTFYFTLAIQKNTGLGMVDVDHHPLL